MRRSISRSLIVLALVTVAPHARAQLVWSPAPAVFVPGAMMAVVSGNPMAAGNYVVRLSMPTHYKIAPHFHPTDEHLKVVKGEFRVGMGDKMNEAKTKKLGVGDTATAPAKVHHYAVTEG